MVERYEDGWVFWWRQANWQRTTPVMFEWKFRTLKDAKEAASGWVEQHGWKAETGWKRESIPDVPEEQTEMFG
jgi:hypothetical protein